MGISCEKITILRQKIIFFPIAEGGAKIFGVFRVKNHDFTPKNHIFSNFRGRAPLDPPLMLVCTVSDGIHACIFLYLGGIGKKGWARCLDIRNELSFHTRCCLL